MSADVHGEVEIMRAPIKSKRKAMLCLSLAAFATVKSQINVAAAQNWTSGINFSSGALQIGAGVTLNNSLTVSTTGTSTTSILGSITGVGNFTKEGSGFLNLGSSAPNSYSGVTTV